MKAKSFEFNFYVKEAEIDDLNHVNNVNYLNWVQHAANKHWALLSNSEIDSEFVWVVLRHEIDYISPAFLNDKIHFTDIARINEKTMNAVQNILTPSLEDYIAVDEEARKIALKLI